MDVKLQEHFAKDFKRKNKMDITDDKKAMRKLKNAVEKVWKVIRGFVGMALALGAATVPMWGLKQLGRQGKKVLRIQRMDTSGIAEDG